MHPVFVRYTAHPGEEAAMEQLVRRHWPVLHAEGLVTNAPPRVIRVARQPGVFLETYEWASWEAVSTAHDYPAVREIWDAMETVGRVEPWDGEYLEPL